MLDVKALVIELCKLTSEHRGSSLSMTTSSPI